MLLALNLQVVSFLPLPEALATAVAARCDGVELWPLNLSPQASGEAGERFAEQPLADAVAQIRARGLRLACLTLGFHALPLALARGGVPAMVEVLAETIAYAVQHRAEVVNCYLAGTPAALFVRAMREAIPAAERAGLTVVLENEAHDDSGRAADVARIVDQVGSSAFATEFDPCNYLHAGEEPFPAAFETLGQRIRYVHLKGGMRHRERPGIFAGSPMREQPDRVIGYGTVADAGFNVDAILARLTRNGYAGWVTLEPHIPQSHILDVLAEDAHWVRQRLPASVAANAAS